MFKVIQVHRLQRIAVFRDGEFDRMLLPGQRFVFTWGSVVELVVIHLSEDLQPLGPHDALPEGVEGARLLRVEPWERAVRLVRGRVAQVLEPGSFRVWEEVPDQDIRKVDLRDVPQPLGAEDVLTPAHGDWYELTGSDRNALVLLRDGVPVRTLPAGRFRFWHGGPWAARVVSTGLQLLDLAVQDLLTSDQVAVRVKPAASWRVVDPLRFVEAGPVDAHIHAAVHLALREILSTRSLEALVSDRAALGEGLLEQARVHLPDLGVALERAWVRDVVLPSDVRAMLNEVTLARKESEALAIRRREEVAATRQLANTAKLLQQNPMLLRLRELEAMTEVAGQIDKLVVVGSPDMLTSPLQLGDVD